MVGSPAIVAARWIAAKSVDLPSEPRIGENEANNGEQHDSESRADRHADDATITEKIVSVGNASDGRQRIE